MKALKMEAPVQARRARRDQGSPRRPSAPPPERGARALADFIEEARDVLDRLEASSRSTRPLELARKETLKLLARRGDWTDIHDLPGTGNLGRAGTRALTRGLTKEGLVEISRDGSYPNMTFLRITPAGREELRRMAAKEAMSYLHGSGEEAVEAAEEARRSLRRLASLIRPVTGKPA